MDTMLEPCRAGYAGCDAMRAENVARHPRTPSARECKHMPIPPERPEKLQGPEIGTECIYRSRSFPDGVRVVVTARSYVWAPGDPAYHGGSRRYDWSVIRILEPEKKPPFFGGNGLCVDDKDLEPVPCGELLYQVADMPATARCIRPYGVEHSHSDHTAREAISAGLAVPA